MAVTRKDTQIKCKGQLLGTCFMKIRTVLRKTQTASKNSHRKKFKLITQWELYAVTFLGSDGDRRDCSSRHGSDHGEGCKPNGPQIFIVTDVGVFQIAFRSFRWLILLSLCHNFDGTICRYVEFVRCPETIVLLRPK